MNILEIMILVVTAGLVLWGWYRGFIKKLASVLMLVLSIVLISAVLPHVTSFLKNSTPLYNYIFEQCEQMVSAKVDSLQTSLGIDLLGGSDSFPDTLLSNASVQTEIIDMLPVPQVIKNMLNNNNDEESYESLNVTSFQDYLAGSIAALILNAISFLTAVILVNVGLRVAFLLLDIFSQLPVIGFANRLAGASLGLVEALFLHWLFFLILTMIQTTSAGEALMTMVNDSALLIWLFESNLFLRIVVWAAAQLL